ncbi:MAG: DUF488 domain-containing protein [Candidatus Heimdallarchaeota archaeon]|nr:DUF488 domain-containing protein [Candidatus Heimdallarchaeota archaeon]
MSDKFQYFTIGVYGYSEEQFFQCLKEACVDTFLDLRNRRGMRGSQYAYANSLRLQERIKSMGIFYLHVKALAPPPEIRSIQREVDQVNHTQKRQRTTMSWKFIDTYKKQVLNRFDFEALFEQLPEDSKNIALFCVEREPSACHRSIVAKRLSDVYGAHVEDIIK